MVALVVFCVFLFTSVPVMAQLVEATFNVAVSAAVGVQALSDMASTTRTIKIILRIIKFLLGKMLSLQIITCPNNRCQ